MDGALAASAGASVGLLARNRPPHAAALIAVIATGRCVVTLSSTQADRQIAADTAALGLQAVLGSAADLARPGVREAAAGAAVVRLDDTGAALTVLDSGERRGPQPARRSD